MALLRAPVLARRPEEDQQQQHLPNLHETVVRTEENQQQHLLNLLFKTLNHFFSFILSIFNSLR